MRGIVFRKGPDKFCGFYGERDGFVFGKAKDNALETLGCGEVEMHNGFLCAAEGFDGAADEVLTAGRKHLEPHIIGNGAGGFDQAAREVEIRLRSGREGDFDFLVADICEELEVPPLLVTVLEKKSER